MVQQGDFSVQLVEAQSKKPFNEIVDKRDNNTYVEVEPFAEYFIRLQRTRTSTRGVVYVVESCVDGKDLGYNTTFYDYYHTAIDRGLVTVNDGVEKNVALLFVPPFRSSRDKNIDARVMFGKVEIRIFEGVLEEFQPDEDFTSVLEAECVVPPVALKNKTVRSTKGTCKLTQTRRTPSLHYKPGPLIDCITLKYCTAEGLLHLGILERPKWPNKKRPVEEAKAPEWSPPKSLPLPKKIKWITSPDSAVAMTREFDLYDLCNESDEEEGGRGSNDKVGVVHDEDLCSSSDEEEDGSGKNDKSDILDDGDNSGGKDEEKLMLPYSKRSLR